MATGVGFKKEEEGNEDNKTKKQSEITTKSELEDRSNQKQTKKQESNQKDKAKCDDADLSELTNKISNIKIDEKNDNKTSEQGKRRVRVNVPAARRMIFHHLNVKEKKDVEKKNEKSEK
ncbi:lamb4 [Acrasis kona]|uniref:Lamb4 n=1 Tax=Acrasis kona TaxID=1008807 RepID=A0AAW2ZRS8_9EUKA